MNHDLRRTILRLILAATLVLPASAAFAQGEVIVATDAFDRPDETPFAIGGNWSRVVAGNYDGHSVLSGSQVHSAFNEGIYYWTGAGAGTFSPTRQFARATVVEQDGEVGLVLLGGADQAIMVGWGPPGVGTTVYIYWYSGGLDHGQLATGPSTLVNGDVIEASLENGLIHARVNGTTVLSVANSTTLTSGVPGFITYLNPGLPGDVGIIDDWEAGTPEAYSISGTILEDAAGLSGVLVSASGGFAGSATTNGSGQYTITGVPPGATSITLTPTLSGHAMSPLTLSVAGPVAADVPGQDFTSTVTTDATLTINASHGSVLRDPIGPTYALGTPVTLTPVPDPGYSFVAWSGDVPAGDETDDPLVVTMDQDRSITATFVAPNVVAADDFNRANETPFAVGGNWAQSFGGGFVNLSGNHVVAGGAEALYYWQGSGTFDNARQFARLKVDQAAGQVGLILLGAANQALVVSWNAGTLYIYWYTGASYQGNLTTTASTLQNGDVIEALLEGGVVYAKRNGAIVTSVANTTSLVAGRPGFETFQTGASFDDWEAGTPESFSLGGTITESAMGLGGVLVTASGGFSASTTTNGSGAWTIPGVPLNATGIVLTPTLGGHTMSPLTRTIPGPVTANVPGQDFTSVPNSDATLTVLASHGSVLTSPAGTTFPLGTPVTLTPVPDPGYAFVGWSGDVPIGDESDNPLVVTMDQDRTIAASFQTPDVIAADDFNRANETPLAIGGNWTKPFGPGTVNLSGNQAVGAGAEALYYWQGPGTFDNARQFARSRVVDAGGQVGLILLGAPNQALVVAWNAGTLYVYWYLGGSHQGELVHEPSVLQDGDEIEAELDNGIIRVKINGAVVRTVANTTSLVAGHPGFETFQTGAIFDDWEAGTPPVPDNIAAVPAPGSAITLGTSCVSVPVVFTRTDATPLMGYSVTFELSANLSLCGAQIVSAGYPQPPQQFLVTPLGGQRWTVDEVTLGSPCGSTGSGTLFTLQVTSATGTGTGTITIESVRARNCLNQSIPAAPGTIASIPIDREAPVRTLDLVATQVKTGNYVGLPDPPHSTTPVRLDFTVPPDAAQVEVYRRPFGGYPQYDENGGSIPALPPALPGAGWTLTTVTASGQLDEPAGRDFWYYALVARDTYGNASAVSNLTGGTLNYHLADFSTGFATCAGDDVVNTADLSFLGNNYGVTPAVNDALECLDVGPTSNFTTDGRPLTDNRIQFEDLIMLALNYGLVGAPQGVDEPRRAPGGTGGGDALTIAAPSHVTAGEVFDARVDLRAGGRLQGLSVALAWNEGVAAPVAVRTGGFLEGSGGVTFSPAPAALDGALLGSGRSGLAGEGAFAIVQFRALRDGDPAVRLAHALGRDAQNQPVALDGTVDGTPVDMAGEIRLLPAAPTPFTSETTIRYTLPAESSVELGVFAIDGRRVRTLQRGNQPAGSNRVAWNGVDDQGRAVPAGVYCARLIVGSQRYSQLLTRLTR